MRKKPLLYISILLFAALAAVGFTLAQHKPVWNDEIYTQVYTVEQFPVWKVLLGKIDEGGNPPLYYLIQKAFLGLAGYSSPPAWHSPLADLNYNDPAARILLRVPAIIYMSSAIVLIFYYFSRYYSIWTGVYSLFITFASLMIWRYWAEARPYGLWVLGTTFQSLIFLHLLRDKNSVRRLWPWFGFANYLLAFTAVFGIAQIVTASFLLWILVERNWCRYLWISLVPAGLCIYYYLNAPLSSFWFDLTPDQLIRECFSRERFYLFYIFLLFIGLYLLQKRTGVLNLYRNDDIKDAVPYFAFAVLSLMAVGCILFIFHLKSTHGTKGFPVSSRYFINTTPIGIIAVTLLTNGLIRGFRDKPWLQVLLAAAVAGLVVPRFLKTIRELKAYFPEMYS